MNNILENLNDIEASLRNGRFYLSTVANPNLSNRIQAYRVTDLIRCSNFIRESAKNILRNAELE